MSIDNFNQQKINEKIFFKIIVVTFIFFNFSSLIFAETIYLKSGKKVGGKIIEKADKYIKIDFKGVPLTYWLDEIERIDEEKPLPTDAKEKGALVVVGDATLTYASYFFTLPLDWIPSTEFMELTHQRGFWRGQYKDGETWIQIVPSRKKPGENLVDFTNRSIQESLRDGGCPTDAAKEYHNFKPEIDYPYKVYFITDCPKDVYGLLVLIDLPEHIIAFNLYGKCQNERCIDTYIEDLKGVIESFKWILGLSDEEIGKMLKNL